MRKTTILSLIIMLVSAMSYGQDTIQRKKNEFVFSLNTPVDFSSLSFGVGYKRAVAKNKFIKLCFPKLEYYETSEKGKSILNLTGSVAVGFEFRHHLTSKLIIFHGPSVGCLYKYIKTNNGYPSSTYEEIFLSENISYTLGIQYQFNENISLSTQLNPRFEVNTTKKRYPDYPLVNSSQTDRGFFIDNSIGAISVAFHF